MKSLNSLATTAAVAAACMTAQSAMAQVLPTQIVREGEEAFLGSGLISSMGLAPAANGVGGFVIQFDLDGTPSVFGSATGPFSGAVLQNTASSFSGGIASDFDNTVDITNAGVAASQPTLDTGDSVGLGLNTLGLQGAAVPDQAGRIFTSSQNTIVVSDTRRRHALDR